MPQFGRSIRAFLPPPSICIACLIHLGCLQEAPTSSVERGVVLLMALTQDASPDIRRTAIESLGKIGDRSALPAVSPLLADPVPVVRAAAAQALGRMARPEDGDVISAMARALEDPSDSVKQAAALAIGDIEPSPRQLTSARDLLRSSDVRVRRATVYALLLLDTGQVVEWLLPLLDDPDQEVRQGAVAALGLSGDARAATALRKPLAQDPSPAVRTEAAYHLGKVSGQHARALLKTAVEKEKDGGVRRWMESELKALPVSD
jgi:HEAT repeat protein